MNSRRLYLWCVVILVPGCAKDVSAPKVTCFATEITTGSVGVSTTVSFQYNSSNQVTSATSASIGTSSESAQTTYTYDADGNITSSTKNSSIQGIITSTYTYDVSHNLLQEDHSTGGVLQSSFFYHYNTTLQLIGADYTYYFGSGSSTTKTRYEYATPVARNPAKIISDQGPEWAFVYDTKPNPNKLLFVSIQPDNNITKMTYSAGTSVTTTTYTYQYDTKGYPVSMASSDGETRTYSYHCL